MNLIFRTNIDTNLSDMAKHSTVDPVTGKVAVTRDTITGAKCNPPIGTDTHIKKVEVTGGNVSDKVTNVIYDIEITVYQTGAAEHFTEADFENNADVHRLASITNLN